MKLPDVLSNISGFAAVAIVIAGVFGFGAVIIAGVIGKPLTPDALALVDRFVNILIGLAVGAGAGGSALALRSLNALEADNTQLRQSLNAMTLGTQNRNQPPLPPIGTPYP